MPRPRFLAIVTLLAACERATDEVVDTDPTPDTDADTDVAPLTVSIAPGTPLAGEQLVCTVEGAGAETPTLAWTVEGDDAGVDASSVPEGRTDAYERWACTASTPSGRSGEDAVDVVEACTSVRLEQSEDIGVVAFHDDLDMEEEAFTIEAWFLDETEIMAVGIQEWPLVVRGDPEAGYDGSRFDYALVRGTSGLVGFRTGGAADLCANLYAPDVAARGCWHHVAGTYDPVTDTKALFVDGVEVATCTTGFRATAVPGPVTIGGMRDTDGGLTPFPGYVDEVRLSRGVRYTGDFEPAIYHRTDVDTRLLLHANATFADPEDDARVLSPDASGNEHHLWLPSGTAEISGAHAACESAEDTCPVDTDVPDTDGPPV